MFCPNCGREINPNASVCLGCGVSVDKLVKKESGSAGAGWWWLGFFIPLAGLLVYMFCQDTEPARAKKAGKGALTGFILSIALTILLYVAYFALIIALGIGFSEMAYLIWLL